MNLSPEEAKLIQAKMAEYTQKWICPIYGMFNAQKGKALGTGILVNYQGQNLVVTAFRNFLWTCLRNENDELLFPTGLAYALPGETEPRCMQGKFLGLKAPLNVGSFSVARTEESPVALPLENGAAYAVAEDELIFIQGFPGAIEDSEDFIRSQSFSAICSVRPPEFPGYNPDLHLGISLGPKEHLGNMGPSNFYPYIEGLRGAPIWGLQMGGDIANWQPENARFLGIIQNWDDKNQLLVVTRENVIAGFLETAHLNF